MCGCFPADQWLTILDLKPGRKKEANVGPQVRPRPPWHLEVAGEDGVSVVYPLVRGGSLTFPTVKGEWKVGDIVDAFISFRWRQGKITVVLDTELVMVSSFILPS